MARLEFYVSASERDSGIPFLLVFVEALSGSEERAQSIICLPHLDNLFKVAQSRPVVHAAVGDDLLGYMLWHPDLVHVRRFLRCVEIRVLELFSDSGIQLLAVEALVQVGTPAIKASSLRIAELVAHGLHPVNRGRSVDEHISLRLLCEEFLG